MYARNPKNIEEQASITQLLPVLIVCVFLVQLGFLLRIPLFLKMAIPQDDIRFFEE